MMKYNIFYESKGIIKLSNLDIFSLPVNLSFLFDDILNISKLKKSIQKLLSIYPFLSGRVKSEHIYDKINYYIELDSTPIFLFYEKINKEVDYKADILKYMNTVDMFPINKDVPLIIFKLTNFNNNSILCVSISHILGDGYTIFNILNILSNIYEFGDEYKYKIIKRDTYDYKFNDNEIQYLKSSINDDDKFFNKSKINSWKVLYNYEYFLYIIKMIYNMYMTQKYTIKLTTNNIKHIKNYISKINISTHDAISALLYYIIYKIEDKNYKPNFIYSVVNFRKHLNTINLGNYTITAEAEIDKKIKNKIEDISKTIRDSINLITYKKIKDYYLDYERINRNNLLYKCMPNFTRNEIWIDSWRCFNIYEINFGFNIIKFDTTFTPIPYFTYIFSGNPYEENGKYKNGIFINITIPKSKYNIFEKSFNEFINNLN